MKEITESSIRYHKLALNAVGFNITEKDTELILMAFACLEEKNGHMNLHDAAKIRDQWEEKHSKDKA